MILGLFNIIRFYDIQYKDIKENKDEKKHKFHSMHVMSDMMLIRDKKIF